MSDPMIPNQALPETVNVFNPEGELVAIPAAQAQQAQAMGYQPANQQQVDEHLDQQKYGDTLSKVKTFTEGIGKGATFGLSRAIEPAFGVSPLDIRKREEVNPVPSAAGEMTGLVVSSLVPGGEGYVAERAGAIAAEHLLPNAALETANVLQKVGSAAVKGAVENAVISSGDEVAKAIVQDPNQSFQTALTDIGLSGLIGAGAGGAFGSINPLWEATAGPKTRTFLNAIKDRAEGNTIAETNAIKVLREDGVEIADHIVAGASDNPKLAQTFNELRESGTMSGETIREDLTKARESVHDSLGRAIDGGEVITPKEAGDAAKEALAKDIESRGTSVRSAYDAVAPSAEVSLEDATKKEIADKIRKAGSEFGAEGAPLRAEFDRFATRLELQKNVGQIDKLMTELGQSYSVAHRAGAFEDRRAFQEIRDIIRDGTNGILDKAIPGAKDAAAVARKTYQGTIEHIQEIGKAAGLGRVKSIGQFQEALEKIPSEKLASRLFDKKNVRALEFLKEQYPQVHDLLAKQMRGEILAKGTSAKGIFNPNNIFREVEKLPDEVRKMVFTPEQLQKISASKEFLSKIPERINPSGTARTLDTLWRHLPTGGGAMVGMLAGHNPIAGMILGQAGKLLSRDVPDAVKLSLLKFLGSSGPVDASAWKTAAELIERTYKGQKLIESATKNVFRAGKAVIPEVMYPDEKKTERLDRKLKELAQNPEPLFSIGGKTAHYMPEHGQSMGEVASNAVSWLNEQRPKPPTLGMLDAPAPIPKEVSDHYTRTLQIAEQPLVALQHLKDGTLQPSDVQTVQTLYPALYQKLSQGLVNQLVDVKSKEEPIAYATKLGLSMFLAQPLDGTMTPEALQTIQASYNEAAQQQAGKKAQQAGTLKALADSPNRSMTPGQSREASHQS